MGSTQLSRKEQQYSLVQSLEELAGLAETAGVKGSKGPSLEGNANVHGIAFTDSSCNDQRAVIRGTSFGFQS